MMNMHLVRRRSLLWFLGLGLGISLGAERASADESKETKDPGGLPVAKLEREERVDFDTDILPFLRKNCLACHNQTDAKGDLVLETTESILAGIEGEAVLVPGKAEESLIFMVSSHREKPIMPPKRNKVGANPLSSEQLALLKLWIDQGATKGSGKAATEREWYPLPPGVHPIYAVAVSADGNYAACGRANQIFVYHVSTGRDLGRLTDPALLESGPYRRPGVAHLDNVQSLAFDPTGSLLASGGYRNVKLWRRSFRPRGLVLDTKSPAARTTTAMASTVDGARLATGSRAGGVYLWALGDDGSVTLERAFVGIHLRAVTALSFSANGAWLGSAAADASVRILSVRTPDDRARGFDVEALVSSLVILGDAGHVAIGRSDGVVQIWELPKADAAEEARPKAVHEWKAHEGTVAALAIFPAEEPQLLSGGSDGKIVHWKAMQGEKIREAQQGGAVLAVAVRGDGKRFASVGENKLARLFDATNGKQLAELKGDLRRRLDVLRRERGEKVAGGRVNETTKTLANLAKDLDKRRGEEKKAAEALAKAAKVLEEKKTASEKAREELAQVETKVKEVEARAKKLAEAVPAAEKAVKDAEAAVPTFQKKLDEATAVLVNFEDEFKKTDAARKEAEKLLAGRRAEADAAKQKLSAVEAEIATLGGRVRAFETKARELSERAAGLATEKKTSESAERDAQKKTAEKDAKRKKLGAEEESQADETARTLEEARRRVQEAVKALEATQKAARRAQGHIQDLEKRTAKLAESHDAAAKIHDTAESAVQEVSKRAREAGSAHEANARRKLEYSAARDAAAKEIEAAQSRVKQSGEALAAARDAATKAQEEAKNAPKEIESKKKAAEAAEKEFKKQEGETAKLESPAQLATARVKDNETAIERNKKSLEVRTTEHKTAQEALKSEQSRNTEAEAKAMLSVVFSTDGKTLATGTSDGRLLTWNADDGSAFDVLPDVLNGAVRALVATKRGWACGGDEQPGVLLSQDATWELERQLGGVDDPETLIDRVTALDFSRDGRFLATAGGDPSRRGELKIWNVSDGKLHLDLAEAHSDTVFDVEFSPNGKYLATCGADKFLKVFSIEDGSKVRTFEGHTAHVLGLSWRFDGRALASSGADGALKIWDFEKGEQSRSIVGFKKQVTGVCFVADSVNTVSCSGDPSVRLHQSTDGKNPRNYGGATEYLYAIDVDYRGTVVAAGGFDSVLRLWKQDDAKALASHGPPEK